MHAKASGGGRSEVAPISDSELRSAITLAPGERIMPGPSRARRAPVTSCPFGRPTNSGRLTRPAGECTLPYKAIDQEANPHVPRVFPLGRAHRSKPRNDL